MFEYYLKLTSSNDNTISLSITSDSLSRALEISRKFVNYTSHQVSSINGPRDENALEFRYIKKYGQTTDTLTTTVYAHDRTEALKIAEQASQETGFTLIWINPGNWLETMGKNGYLFNKEDPATNETYAFCAGADSEAEALAMAEKQMGIKDFVLGVIYVKPPKIILAHSAVYFFDAKRKNGTTVGINNIFSETLEGAEQIARTILTDITEIQPVQISVLNNDKDTSTKK